MGWQTPRPLMHRSILVWVNIATVKTASKRKYRRLQKHQASRETFKVAPILNSRPILQQQTKFSILFRQLTSTKSCELNQDNVATKERSMLPGLTTPSRSIKSSSKFSYLKRAMDLSSNRDPRRRASALGL